MPMMRSNISSVINSDQRSKWLCLEFKLFHVHLGTVVALANENGVVCGFGCVSGMSKVHNRPVNPGYLSVFFTSVVPGKTVAPPFPGPFDEDVVRPGESYIWPVDRMFVAGPDNFTHSI